MEKNIKISIKIISFLVVVILIFGMLNHFFRRDWNAEALNIYDEPKNTIETLFIGSSMTEFGIDVMTLYEEYGICAYNLGNSGQPVLASYYWLEEAYKYQSESLKSIVFDVSILKSDLRTSYYRTATENMKFSSVKYDAVGAYATDYNQTISYLFPLFSYHSRWDKLTSDDFGTPSSMLYQWTRGQCFSTDTPFATLEEDELLVWDYTLDEDAKLIELDAEGIEYFEKMLEFCRTHDLELILIKTPNPLTWSSSDHNTFEALAEEYEVVFLDFNFAPLLHEISYDAMFDSMDGIHLNYYGSQKLAMWMGDYLIKNGYANDIRRNERYAFMEEEQKEYKENIQHLVKMRACMDPTEYLALAGEKENYTIFITIKNDGANKLTDAQREAFDEAGFEKLAKLSNGASYIAVIDNGTLVYEKMKHSDTEKKGKLTYQGELENGALYTLMSGGASMGEIASCKIEGTEYAINENGINIVVYDKETKNVVDRAVFDTSVYHEREVAVESVLSNKWKALEEGETIPLNLEKYAKYLKLLEGEE